MRKKITIFAMLLATLILEVPAGGFGGSENKPVTVVPANERSVNATAEQPRRRRRGRRVWRNGGWVWVSYNNYPRYRSYYSPRYRTVRRYYWDDGIRRSRYVRVYF